MKKKAYKLTEAQKVFADLMKVEVKQAMSTDAGCIAKIIGKNEATVRLYMRGRIMDLTVASVILTELRKLIADSEQFAMEYAT